MMPVELPLETVTSVLWFSRIDAILGPSGAFFVFFPLLLKFLQPFSFFFFVVIFRVCHVRTEFRK